MTRMCERQLMLVHTIQVPAPVLAARQVGSREIGCWTETEAGYVPR